MPRPRDDHHHHHHGHDDRHDHGQAHHGMVVSPAAASRRTVHRLDRRRFLAELGRNTFAVAIVGGAAACSDAGEPAADEPVADAGASGIGPRWAQVSLGFVSAYVLVRGNEAAVIDTGTSGSAAMIGETLGTLGSSFDDVRHVILTHAHGDHVGSLSDVLEAAPDAAAYAGEGDIPSISAPIDVTAVFDGDDVLGLEIIETPGHTPGSIAALDREIGLLIAGDALNGDGAGASITGPNARFTADMDAAADSVDKLAAFDFEIAVFGHGQPVLAGADELVRGLG